jgi:hypothetical protein
VKFVDGNPYAGSRVGFVLGWARLAALPDHSLVLLGTVGQLYLRPRNEHVMTTFLTRPESPQSNPKPRDAAMAGQ